MSAGGSASGPHAHVPPDPAAEYLTPAEVAVKLRRSRKRVYAIINDRSFPKLRLPGGQLLVPRLAFERWCRDRTEGMRGPLRLAAIPGTSEALQRTDAPHALNGAVR